MGQALPQPDARDESEIEIRQVFEAEDFGEEFTPELRAQEDRIRELGPEKSPVAESAAGQGLGMMRPLRGVQPDVGGGGRGGGGGGEGGEGGGRGGRGGGRGGLCAGCDDVVGGRDHVRHTSLYRGRVAHRVAEGDRHCPRLVRDVGLAEDLAQDALVAALEQWPGEGIPRNPGAWLMTAARRRASTYCDGTRGSTANTPSSPTTRGRPIG